MNKNTLTTQPLSGFNDFYPEDQVIHDYCMDSMASVAQSFGFQRYSGPILEQAELYRAKSGDELGGEQLYHFADKGGRQVAVRPELTPSLARMVARKGSALSYPLRWFSIANLLRYERPQRGRQREHWQINVDIIGTPSVFADAEAIQVAHAIMQKFGATADMYKVKINNRTFMQNYLAREVDLNEEQQLATIKMIDRVAKLRREDFDAALSDIGLNEDQLARVYSLLSLTIDEVEARYSDIDGAADLVALFGLLDSYNLGEVVTFDPTIARGMAYYTGTVFELHDLHPMNRRALFGGGRYDNLMQLFQDDPVPAIGFGCGNVTIRNFLEVHGLLPNLTDGPDAMIVFPDKGIEVVTEGAALANELRAAGLSVTLGYPDQQSVKKQFKLANKQQVKTVLIFGEQELADGKVQVKDMATGAQQAVERSEIVHRISERQTE